MRCNNCIMHRRFSLGAMNPVDVVKQYSCLKFHNYLVLGPIFNDLFYKYIKDRSVFSDNGSACKRFGNFQM